MKRAAIYFFYDADGVVDRYVEYILKELHTVSDYLLVVVNGTLLPEGRRKFADIADDFFVRQNDFDAPAYKDGIEFITWEKLLEYDELILSSATFYGPLRPFKEIFSEMDGVKCDYWGITKVHRNDNIKRMMGADIPWGYRPDYVASNFHVYRSRLLHSYEFRKHWEKLPEITSYADSAIYHEMSFAVKMANAGFTFDTLDRSVPESEFPSSTVAGAYDLIARYNVPFVRRKAIFDPNGSNFDYGAKVPAKTLRYISEHTGYDVGMIWENQLRTNTLFDLKNWVGLHRILPADIDAGAEKPGISHAVLLYLRDRSRLTELSEYLGAFAEGTRLLLCVNAEQLDEAAKESVFERFDLETMTVNGENEAITKGGERLLEEGFEAVCFLTDPDVREAQYTVVNELWNTQCYENAVCSPVYVENVLRVLEKEPRAGMLVPAAATHAEYFGSIGGSWGSDDNIHLVGEALKKLGRKVPFTKDKPPAAPFGTAFWFRTAALEPLLSSEGGELCADTQADNGWFRCLCPLVAQSNGYYTLELSETGNAGAELLHLSYQCGKLRQTCVQSLGCEQPKNLNHLLAMIQNTSKRIAAKSAGSPAAAKPEEKKSGSKFKRFIKACMPKGLWNLLRKAKCKALGWGYVE